MNPHEHYAAAHASTLIDWWALLPLGVALALYLLPAIRQRGQGRPWSPWRTAGWMAGIVLIGIAISPPVMSAARGDLRWHMVQHLAIGMFAPLGLVMAAPMTLMLRSVPVGAGRAFSAALRSGPAHIVSHPVTALILNIGGMYALYLTPLFARSMASPALHWLVMMHFLAAGYLFTWAIAGPDPAPRRPGFTVRVVVLVVSLGLHAFLGKLMYVHLPQGVPFGADEVREAAVLMYYGGDIAELLLATALFASWYGSRRRQRRRIRAAAPTPLRLATVSTGAGSGVGT